MRIATPNDVARYAICPKRASHQLGQTSALPFDTHIVSDVIKAAYIYQSQRGNLPRWKHIPSWIDKYYQKALGDMLPAERYGEAKNVLQRLHTWYYGPLQTQMPGPAITNVPISVPIGNDLLFKDTIDLVHIEDEVQLCDIVEIDNIKKPNKIGIYNDMVTHARIWGFCMAARTKPDKYARIFIGPETVRPLIIGIDEEMLAKTAKIVKHILYGMAEQVDYPAFSAHCVNCPYNQRCTI